MRDPRTQNQRVKYTELQLRLTKQSTKQSQNNHQTGRKPWEPTTHPLKTPSDQINPTWFWERNSSVNMTSGIGKDTDNLPAVHKEDKLLKVEINREYRLEKIGSGFFLRLSISQSSYTYHCYTSKLPQSLLWKMLMLPKYLMWSCI